MPARPDDEGWKLFDRCLSTIVALGVLAICVITFLQVVFRYGFAYSLAWAEEVATFIMIWTAMLGLASHLGHGRMISLDVLEQAAHGRARMVLVSITSAATIAFLAVVVVLGFRMTVFPLTTGVSSAAEIPIQWIYAAFPVGGTLMILQIGRQLRRAKPVADDEIHPL